MKWPIVVFGVLLMAGCQTTISSQGGDTRFVNCKQQDFDGPGPGVTGGYKIDYQGCYIGSDVYDNESVTGLACENGIDIGNELFLDVIAAAPGTVVDIIRDDDSKAAIKHGAWVYVRHTYFSTGYHHLENIPVDLQVGDTVERGEKIGEVGLSGNTRRPHLHFDTHKYDPRGYRGHKGRFIFTHHLWAVDEAQMDSKIIKVPFAEDGGSYPDDKLTFPMPKGDCRDHEWNLIDHPTKPWRGR